MYSNVVFWVVLHALLVLCRCFLFMDKCEHVKGFFSQHLLRFVHMCTCGPTSTQTSGGSPMSLWKWVNGKSNEVGSCPLVPWEISQQESELISPSLTRSQWWGGALDHAPYMLHVTHNRHMPRHALKPLKHVAQEAAVQVMYCACLMNAHLHISAPSHHP